jgi:hypothetical protein
MMLKNVFYRLFLLFIVKITYFTSSNKTLTMKTKFILLFFFAICSNIHAQIDYQKRFQSDSRKYYVWNSDVEKYELKETEYENSVIDIREIGSKTNGYIVISMNDNGQSRLHHGSIYEFKQNSEEEGTWYIRSKFMKAKLTYNPKQNTITYLYDANDKRYNRLMIFVVSPDEAPNASLKALAKEE